MGGLRRYLELQAQAIPEVAGEHAGRIESLQDIEHLSDEAGRCAKLVGEIVEVEAQIARFVEGVDQVGADEPLGGIGDDHVELLGQIVGERQAGGDIVFEVGILAAEGVVCARAQ